MHKAINGLSTIVQQNFKLDSFSNSLFYKVNPKLGQSLIKF
ncbi:transposase [Blautia producta ATCC 27340 = DSM 2950]|nr:transposase [Blautia producta ATCC 27340 = DSM 2950]